MEKHSHCSYCGTAFTNHENRPWPRTCGVCENTTFLNPTPVAVLLQPVDGGILAIRRDIEPKKGELALPGGYVDSQESWKDAAARELREETSIEINSEDVQVFDVENGTIHDTIIIVGLAPEISKDDLPEFEPNREVTERVILREFEELAFDIHTKSLASWFSE